MRKWLWKRTLSHLREQNSKLRRHVERQQEKCGKLEHELAELRAVTDPSAFQQRLGRHIREERLQIAQERAALVPAAARNVSQRSREHATRRTGRKRCGKTI